MRPETKNRIACICAILGLTAFGVGQAVVVGMQRAETEQSR